MAMKANMRAGAQLGARLGGPASAAWAAALALAAAVAIAAALAAGFEHPTWAFADETSTTGESDNTVDVSQLPDSSFIYDTSIADLSTADTYYDRQTVQITGEVIGDKILVDNDDRHCWITLSASGSPTERKLTSSASSSSASSAAASATGTTAGSTVSSTSKSGTLATATVYMTKEAAEKIDLFGKYGQKGTTLQVRGTFHLACSEHSGVSDIHATVVTVTQKGKATADTFDPAMFVPGIIAVAIGLALMLLFRYLQERQR